MTAIARLIFLAACLTLAPCAATADQHDDDCAMAVTARLPRSAEVVRVITKPPAPGVLSYVGLRKDWRWTFVIIGMQIGDRPLAVGFLCAFDEYGRAQIERFP